MEKRSPALAAILMTVVTSGPLMRVSMGATGEDYSIEQYPFHQSADELVVTRTRLLTQDAVLHRSHEWIGLALSTGTGFDARADEKVATLPCERVPLEVQGRNSHHIGASIGRTSDGHLYAVIGGGPALFFMSTDDGRKWTRCKLQVPDEAGFAAFAVLADNSFLGVTGGGTNPIRFYRSGDRGRSWDRISELVSGPFDAVYVGGSILQLRDGALLFPVNWRVNEPEGGNLLRQGLFAQYMVRSNDGGRGWQNGPDPVFWRHLIEANLTVAGTNQQARNPGSGGGFPGCFETGLVEHSDGKILAALRYSGAPQPWHTPEIVRAWRGGEPDVHGRMFKNVLLGESPDGGQTWQNLRPVRDAEGQTLLPRGDTSAVLVEVPDSRLVMVIVRRRPLGQCQLIGKVSEDGGQTWLPEEYRVMAGFGYPSSLALPDGTIVTVSGKTVPEDGEKPDWALTGRPRGAEVIRWRLPER